MTAAVRVENLSKHYRIGARAVGYRTLRESLMSAAAAPWRHILRACQRRSLATQSPLKDSRYSDGDFWALRDVNFEITHGDVVGVIGRNGAGKSTLLKVLSRVTEPTSGRVILRGRVGSLLEVGTGFHPELSGRENIYMNGSILGMTRREIASKFDDIVDFAEIGEFLDTPVKRYSSGMYVRLAFAVAAHLEPEILIVDEVLAVGDAAFQKKCLGKMKDVARTGRTVLFVSHQMSAVSSLCAHAIWLNDGAVHATGPAAEIVRQYLAAGADTHDGTRDLRQVRRAHGDQQVRFTRIRVLDEYGAPTPQIGVGRPFTIELEVASELTVEGEVGLTLKTEEGLALFTTSSNDEGGVLNLAPGVCSFAVRIDPNYLRPGRYFVQIGTTCVTLRDLIEEAISVDIAADRHYSRNRLYSLPGTMHFPYTWTSLDDVKHHDQ
jgi:lipopolysaccharide transport system ATP-binding protein